MWPFGGSSRNLGSPEKKGGDDILKRHRSNQLVALEQNVPNVQKKAADSSLFEVALAAPPDGRAITLRIFLPAKFPEEKPVLQLLSQVSHPWVNSYMQIVGHPQLIAWDGSQQLHRIVTEVVADFRARCGAPQPPLQHQQSYQSPVQQHPQPIVNIAGQYLPPRGNPTYQPPQPQATFFPPQNTTHPSHSPMPSQNSHQQPQQHTRGIPVPAHFPEIDNMTLAQVQRLLVDDVALSQIVADMSSVKEMKQLHKEMCASNAQLAQQNMDRSQRLDELREEVRLAKVQLQQEKDSYSEECARIFPHGLGGAESTSAVIQEVRKASREADERSEKTSEKFLAGEIDPATFLDQYLSERQLYHLLRGKWECTRHMLRSK